MLLKAKLENFAFKGGKKELLKAGKKSPDKLRLAPKPGF
jgi:hypothetical protein